MPATSAERSRNTKSAAVASAIDRHTHMHTVTANSFKQHSFLLVRIFRPIRDQQHVQCPQTRDDCFDDQLYWPWSLPQIARGCALTLVTVSSE
eukprot:6202764-Pleurochrysis_carterae.AAC.2